VQRLRRSIFQLESFQPKPPKSEKQTTMSRLEQVMIAVATGKIFH